MVMNFLTQQETGLDFLIMHLITLVRVLEFRDWIYTDSSAFLFSDGIDL